MTDVGGLSFVLLAVGALLVVWGASVYNRLVGFRNRYRNAFAQIDVQLKRRYDLVPSLVETAKTYLRHERETLESVISARSRAISASARAAASPGDSEAMTGLSGAESGLAGALGRLHIAVEHRPVDFTDLAILKLLGKAARSLRIAREDDGARDRSIEAVRDAEIDVAWLVVAFLEMGLDLGFERGDARRHALGQASGLGMGAGMGLFTTQRTSAESSGGAFRTAADRSPGRATCSPSVRAPPRGR